MMEARNISFRLTRILIERFNWLGGLAHYSLRFISSSVLRGDKKKHTLLTVSLSLNHQATLGFFPPDMNEVGGKDRAQLIIYGSLSFV